MAAADTHISNFRRRLKEALEGKVRTREREVIRREMLYDFKEDYPVSAITMEVAEFIQVEVMLLGQSRYGPIPEGFMQSQRELEFLSSCRRIEGLILTLLAEHRRMVKLCEEEDAQDLIVDDESSSPEC